MSRLSGTLSNVQATHELHESNHEAVNAEQSQLDEKEREMRELVASAEAKRAWMFDFHEWMETVATFLDEKVCALDFVACQCVLKRFSLFVVVPHPREIRRGTHITIDGTAGYADKTENRRR